MRAPNVYTIPPACSFLDTFVRAFLAGEVVSGLAEAGDPLRLAGTRIYVPTQRSARALADSLRAHCGGASVVLPRILPLGALEATEPELIFAEPDPDLSGLPLPAAASSIWRRLQLATLIKRWSDAISGALRSVDTSGRLVVDSAEPFRVATSTADAFALAGDLARLIDELTIEGVAWHALDDLRMAEFDDYWRITTTFLSIAVTQWPAVLSAHGLKDRAERQIALIEAQERALADGSVTGPVIAIGSTGSNRATARLLAAIARAPQGAVVLPGLDMDMDEAGWAIISGRLQAKQEPSFGHPQAALARLLPVLDIARADVVSLGTPNPVAALRARFVAEALRPADTTERWRGWRRATPRDDIEVALGGVSLVEAADEREEALCLAIAVRETLETPGRTVALITPDRELARRVRVELLRWNIEVSDTGGEPLANRPLGILARLVAAAAAGRMAARDVGALLAHPLATLGRSRDGVARLAAMLEVGVLRAVAIAGKSDVAIFADARAAAADRHAHPSQKVISPADWVALADLWRDLDAAVAPLVATGRENRLGAWVEAHRAALAAVIGTSRAAIEEQVALETIFAELEGDAGGELAFDAEGYGILFARLAHEATLRTTDQPHPQVQIFGLLEARLMSADVVLLGGLDETIWPPQAQSDPFLNRPMRNDLGLSPPERRLGQTAHDFVQATGSDTVILSRAAKRSGSPCVPSRFLLRLEALGGKEWNACRERGARLVGFARTLDSPLTAPVPAKRPRPMPPVELRPTRLSVTQIETLRRDPYAIHAAHILRIMPLPRDADELGPAEFGNLMHRALQEFVASESAGGTPEVRRTALRALVLRTFGAALDDPIFAAFRWPVIEKTMNVFLAFDAKQRESADEIGVEIDGRLTFPLADLSTFTLGARADRIDRHRDGSVTLVDYKTGQPPGSSEVQVGFAPQLTLEAAMLREGGFGPKHLAPISAVYLKLGGKDGGFVRQLKFDDEPFDGVVQRHYEGLQHLLSSFRDKSTGYPARPFPKFAKRAGDYDHLARVREWSLAADEDGAP